LGTLNSLDAALMPLPFCLLTASKACLYLSSSYFLFFILFFLFYFIFYTFSSFNIHSLLNKFHEISFILDLQLIDILVLNETWLDQNIDNNLFENSFYQMIRRDRTTSTGGGIIVYIKKSIQVNLLMKLLKLFLSFFNFKISFKYQS
jgi:hypothetical protein